MLVAFKKSPRSQPADGSDPSDSELMVSLQGGDHRAYEVLYARWSERLFHFLIRRAGSRTVAEEALQETWLRVYRYRHRYQPGRRFSAWLYTIAAHAGHDAREPDSESFDWEPPTRDQHHLRDYLVRALHSLSPTDRRAILLSLEGFSSAEIGEMLKIRPGTVRMRIKRAREHIKASLGSPD